MFGTVADVRKALVTVFIFGQALFVFGQEQENKLADRLLRPNMTLSNADQTKHFYSERGQTTSSSARVKTFDTREDTQPKQFPERRSFFARVFGTHSLQHSAAKADLSTRSDTAANVRSVNPPDSRLPRQSADQSRLVASRDYAVTHPFVERGKSQKFLNQQNPPLTVDQVRELLNRNK
ncbi:MAG: hypothetical protein ACJ8KU_04105 [Chthoniobacterales bacterium]